MYLMKPKKATISYNINLYVINTLFIKEYMIF